ncbi:MAG: DUF1942 domain-containing protein [Mycobacterium sp.]
MKFFTTAMAAAGALAVAGTISAATAAADVDNPTPATHPIGTQGTVVEGPIVQGWTISDLKPSSDVIPYQPRGTLWEATATDEAIQGTVVPIVGNLSARTASGQDYPALFGVPTPQGVVPVPLAQGQKTSGKLYFDVTGTAPNSAVYQNNGQILATWVQAPPPSPARASAPTPAQTGTRAPAPVAHPAPAARPAPPATAPADSQSTPPASASQGTPLPEDASESPSSTGSSGTPLPADASGASTPAGGTANQPTP